MSRPASPRPGDRPRSQAAGAVDFFLVPFGDPGDDPGIRIAGSLRRGAGALDLRFSMTGDLSRVVIPPPAPDPRRMGRLWEATCFELFLSPAGREEYWEFNFSPAGHWNACRFARYREEMREEPAFVSIPFDVRSASGSLELSANLEIAPIVPNDAPLHAGANAVVLARSGGVTYWALVHPGPRPDFHHRGGFRMLLSPPAD